MVSTTGGRTERPGGAPEGNGARARRRLRARVICLVALVASMMLAAVPAPALSAVWTGSGPGTAEVVSDGSASAPEFRYALYGDAVWETNTWRFSATTTASGPIDIGYVYSGFHAFYDVEAFLRAFVTHDGNTTSTTLVAAYAGGCCSPPSQGFGYTGTATLDVEPGDTVGFELGGRNYDSDARLLGTLTLDDAGVTPADTAPPALDLPDDLTAPAAGPQGAAVTFTASATDQVDGDVPASCTPASGATFPVCATQVACRAEDAAGERRHRRLHGHRDAGAGRAGTAGGSPGAPDTPRAARPRASRSRAVPVPGRIRSVPPHVRPVGRSAGPVEPALPPGQDGAGEPGRTRRLAAGGRALPPDLAASSARRRSNRSTASSAGARGSAPARNAVASPAAARSPAA